MPIGPVPSGSMPMPGSQMPVIPSEPVTLNEEQHTKLSRELEVVSGNVRVMSEMLTELSPSNVEESDLELLQVGGAKHVAVVVGIVIIVISMLFVVKMVGVCVFCVGKKNHFFFFFSFFFFRLFVCLLLSFLQMECVLTRMNCRSGCTFFI